MSLSTFSIGGLSSGLDTNAIVSQLIQLERLPLRQMEQRQAELRAVSDAWSTVSTRMSALRSAVDGIATTAAFAQLTAVSSSDPAVVGVTRSGTPAAGDLSFTVRQLAAAHQAAGDPYGAADAAVGGGRLRITVGTGDDAVTHELVTGDDTTLTGLARAVNELGVGVGAQVVKVADGAYRLVLTGERTGGGGAFAAAFAPDGGDERAFTVTRQARDAELLLGEGDGALLVTRPGNTVDDLMPGITLELRKVSGTAVTVSASRDTDAAVAGVRKLVDAVNQALGALSDLSRPNPGGPRQPLSGDPTVRRLVDQLRLGVSGLVLGHDGAARSPADVGVALTRDGRIELDADQLRQAFAEDFAATAALFGRAAAATDERITSATPTEHTQAGSYAVLVTQTAARATAHGTTFQPPQGGPETFTITTASGVAVPVTVDEGADLDSAVATINAALAASGVSTITARADGGTVRLESTRYGSAARFSVAGDGDALGLSGNHQGRDVAGVVGGRQVVGSGQLLTVRDGPATGLALRVTADGQLGEGESLDLGSVSVSAGLSGALAATLRAAEGPAGSIARARAAVTRQDGLVQERIDRFESRLERREADLMRQFTAMESALARLMSQGNWLASQLAGMRPPQ